MIRSIQYACVCHTGYLRRRNEDNYVCGTQYRRDAADGTCTRAAGTLPVCCTGLFGVFDGMGGLPHGEDAARIAAAHASTFTPGLRPLRAMSRLCADADEAVRSGAAFFGVREIGTTAALLSFSRRHAVVCNVGDSRIYRLAGGKLTQLSACHVTPSVSGGKPLLTQNLGMPPEAGTCSPHLKRLRCRPDEVFLVCSDGLTDTLPEEEIGRFLSILPPQYAADRLLTAALESGGRDNITIMICVPRADGGTEQIQIMHDKEKHHEGQ